MANAVRGHGSPLPCPLEYYSRMLIILVVAYYFIERGNGLVMSAVRTLGLCLMLVALVSATTISLGRAEAVDVLTITVASDKSAYYYREPISLFGDFTMNGEPVTNGLVGVSIYDSSNPSLPIAFRTVKTGQTYPTPALNFEELFPTNETGVPKTSFVPLESLWLRVSVKNYDAVEHYQITTVTVFDANGVPLFVRSPFFGTILPGKSSSTFFMASVIPVTAQPGNATLVACVFSGFPQDGGFAYCEEKRVNFEIKRNPQIVYSSPPMSDPWAPSGSYASSMRLTAELKPGDYQAYVTARSTVMNGSQQSLQTAQDATVFSIVNAMTPPQAAFTYYPVQSFVNMSITFDASASTAEGYGVSIVKYEWDFGDLTPPVTKTTPTVAHTFTSAGNYTVTLNVTDSQGLWCTTSKLVPILPPQGPSPDFLVYPATPKANQQAVFDATITVLGWDGTTHPPIATYTWDFGDQNVTTTSSAKTVHTYAAFGDYSVTLNVTDTSGYNGTITKTVRVRLAGIIGDVNGDGIVDVLDAILLSNAYNATPGDDNWNPNADLNDDLIVDILDAIVLANHFGETE